MATNSYSYYIELIQPNDETAVRKHMNSYKMLRLFALKSDPEAFHSTYARESAFTDDFWYQRLSNPAANTFVAFNISRVMVSMTTVMGPLPYRPHVLPVLGTAVSYVSDEDIMADGKQLHYRLNAVYTHPDARRRGVGIALIKKAVTYVENKVPASGKKDLVISVAVELGNPGAQALYEKCGFVETMRIHKDDEAYLTNIAMLEYKPSSE